MKARDGSTDVPIAVGLTEQTEGFDPFSDAWIPYWELPRRVYAAYCLTVVGDKLYSFDDSILEVDLQTGQSKNLGRLPDTILYPRQCAAARIGRDDGVFLRSGFFYNLRTGGWEKYAPALANELTTVEDTMTSINGLPTLFGVADIDETFQITRRKIWQYKPFLDRWIEIGEMTEDRSRQVVLEVPQEFCDQLIQ